MSRLLFPDDRFVYRISGTAFFGAPGSVAVFYTDAAATVLADVRVHDGSPTPGAAYAGSSVAVDAYSLLPLFWGPDGADTLYAVVSGGPVTPVYARVEDRLDANTAAIATRYTKPGAGIPSTDLTAAAQTSLGKADSALQTLPSGLMAASNNLSDLADAAAARTNLGLDTAATQASTAFDAAGAAASAQAASQPLDSDLTAIAALTTTSFGRSRLIEADAAAARSALGLGTAATQNTTAFDAAGAATAAVAALGATVTKTGAYTLVTGTDKVVLADASAGGFTLTLPTAVGFTAQFVLAAINTNTNLTTLATTSAQTIDGAATLQLGPAGSGATYRAVTLVSDGANWRVV